MTPAQLLEAARAAGLTVAWAPGQKLTAHGPGRAASLGREILDRRAEFTRCRRCGGVAPANGSAAILACPACTTPSGRDQESTRKTPRLWRCGYCGLGRQAGSRCDGCGWAGEASR